MQYPLLQTKLFIPPTRGNLIARARLVHKLNSGLGDILTEFERKLSLISAPAGFGKTSLITQWLTQLDRSSPTAWIALDEDDSDPQQFFNYLA